MDRKTFGSTAEAAIVAVIEDRAAAISAKDAVRAIAHAPPYAVAFDIAPPLQQPGEAARRQQYLDAWFATWEGPIGYELRDLEVAASGDVAFSHGFVRIHGTKTDGERVDVWMRETLGLRNLAGAWKVVHEHSSVPFHMDGSYRAAVDLEP
jgi:PhnB protein